MNWLATINGDMSLL